MATLTIATQIQANRERILLSLYSTNLDPRNPRLRISIECSVIRLPGESIIARLRKSIIGSRSVAIRSDPFLAQEPAFTIPGPAAFRKTTFAIKGPGTNTTIDRVPADDLPAFEGSFAITFDGDIASNEVTAPGPDILTPDT